MRQLLARTTQPFDYQVARTNDQWPDHQLRTLATAAAIAWLQPDSIIDPACGDGSIVLAADRIRFISRALLGDISRPNILKLATRLNATQRLDWTLTSEDITQALRSPDRYQVVVLTEILEHLKDPDAILRLAHLKGGNLVVSSPEMRPGQVDPNPEHLWMFDGKGYEEMLNQAGWNVIQKTHLAFRSMYDFAIWVCG